MCRAGKVSHRRNWQAGDRVGGCCGTHGLALAYFYSASLDTVIVTPPQRPSICVRMVPRPPPPSRGILLTGLHTAVIDAAGQWCSLPAPERWASLTTALPTMASAADLTHPFVCLAAILRHTLQLADTSVVGPWAPFVSSCTPGPSSGGPGSCSRPPVQSPYRSSSAPVGVTPAHTCLCPSANGGPVF